MATRLESRRARTLRRYETLWQPYVEWFIKQHSLDDSQTQKAMVILEQCQELAKQYLTSKTDALEQLVRESVTASTQPATRPSSQPSSDATRLNLDELMKPVDEIFETKLKPRLDALLTRAQRDRIRIKNAGAGASTQPGTR